MTSNTSNDKGNDAIENQMIKLHKEKSESLKEQVDDDDDDDNDTEVKATSTSTVQNHLKRQRELFDNLSEFFDSDDATPDEVKPLLSYLMKNAERVVTRTMLLEAVSFMQRIGKSRASVQ